MKNSWLIWVFIVGIVVTILVALNYQGSKEVVPLSEIFPEEETFPVDVEYEFVNQENSPQENIPQEVQSTPSTQETVQIEKVVIPPQSQEVAIKQEEPIKPEDSASKPFTIQVASFQTKDKAQKTLEKMLQENNDAFILSKSLKDKGTWYRVYVGKFDTKAQAEQFLTGFKKNYPGSFVISLR